MRELALGYFQMKRFDAKNTNWAVLLTACLTGCDSPPSDPDEVEIIPVGSVARAYSDASTELTSDETPIVVDLYPYEDIDANIGDYPENQYIVSGLPLRFVFPKSALRSYQNWQGGPQNNIRLGYDRETLEPIGRLLADRSEDERIGQAYRRIYANNSRDLSIDLMGNAVNFTMGEMEGIRRSRYGAEPIAAEICGFDFVVEPYSYNWPREGVPEMRIGSTSLPAHYYLGVAQSSETTTRLISCGLGARICRLTFGYEDRQVSYALPTDQICEHEEFSQGIASILDRHRSRLRP